jgi:hypothetical protein
MPIGKLPAWVLEDLAKSGLTRRDAGILKIRHIPAVEMKIIHPKLEVDGYELPYFDIDGNVIDFSRIKLRAPTRLTRDGKPAKYFQRPGSGSKLYLPPYCNWRTIASDAGIAIIITEGEKKAAAGCKAGLPTIAIAGVWNWLERQDD